MRKIDAHCSEVRREALRGPLPRHRQTEINEYLYSQAIIIAQIATSGTRLSDDTRPYLLSVFLTLINVCERVARGSGENVAAAPLPAVPPPMVMAMPAAGAK